MPSATSVILIGDDGWTNIEPSLLTERTTSVWGFHKRWWQGVGFYARDGNRYEVASAQPVQLLPPLSKLLAATFYNPRLTVRYEYRNVGHYELAELRRALHAAIDRDDDVLTQFHEAKELKRRLDNAASFDDVAEVLRLAVTDI